jgi:hypothetical protein
MGWVVNATPRPLYPRERPTTYCVGGWVGPRIGLDGCGKSRPNRDSIPGPSSSESVYRRCYLGPSEKFVVCHTYNRSKKGKAIPLLALTGPEGSRKLRLLDLRQSAHEVGKVVSPTHRPPLLQQIFLVLISVRDWVDPRAIVRPEGLCQWKIPITPSWIDPATYRFVAKSHNHCATACSHNRSKIIYKHAVEYQ